jgi:hypothetical protein
MATTPASTAAPTIAASQSSLNTVLNTIEQGTEVLQKVLPDVALIGGFVPGGTVFIQLVGLALPAVQNAIKFIMQEEGKDPMTAFEDFLNHISPGGPNSPALTNPQSLAEPSPASMGMGTRPSASQRL